jgi:hypothetical protein
VSVYVDVITEDIDRYVRYSGENKLLKQVVLS